MPFAMSVNTSDGKFAQAPSDNGDKKQGAIPPPMGAEGMKSQRGSCERVARRHLFYRSIDVINGKRMSDVRCDRFS